MVEHSYSHCILVPMSSYVILYLNTFCGRGDVMGRIEIESHGLRPFDVSTVKSQTHLQISCQSLAQTFIQTEDPRLFNNYCLK